MAKADRGRSHLAGDVAALALPFVVAGIGSIATLEGIPGWYRTLDKPDWKPPDRAFGPVWTTLYLLMGLAMVITRRTANADGGDAAASGRLRLAEVANGLQLSLNLAWSLVFFGGRSVSGGLIAIVLLWASIVLTIATFARIDRRGALLLLPYLGWVTFATFLNLELWRRNRDRA